MPVPICEKVSFDKYLKKHILKKWSVTKSTKLLPLFVRDVCEKRNIGTQKQLGKIGEPLKKYKIRNSDNTVKKIICINKLNLPDVLIDIIKDYLYYSCDYVLYKSIKTNVNKSIKKIYREGEYVIGDQDEYIYECRIDYYMSKNVDYYESYYSAMSISICSICGNYTNVDLYNDNTVPHKLLCNCIDNPYYQEEDEIQEFYTVNISNSYIRNNF